MINHKLFVEFLRVYSFQPATAFWRAIEVDVLKKHLPQSGLCLDLGCGDGKLTSLLYDSKVPPELSFVGIDSDPDETKQAETFSFYKRIHTCLASNIPEDKNIFDFALSNSVLEHIQDIENTLVEVSRLLKPGGSFLFTVPALGFHQCLYGPLFNRGNREDYLREMDKRLAHYRYWTIDEWQTNLSNSGMTIESSVEYFDCKEVQRWETISRFTAGIVYALGKRKYSPIEVQKKLGLRKTQNRISLPHWLAGLLSSILSIGINKQGNEQNACLLILARKL